jgi:hypothetical protein
MTCSAASAYILCSVHDFQRGVIQTVCSVHDFQWGVIKTVTWFTCLLEKGSPCHTGAYNMTPAAKTMAYSLSGSLSLHPQVAFNEPA